MRYVLHHKYFLSGPMKSMLVFGIALLASFAARAQDKFIKISDTTDLQMPAEANQEQHVKPGPKGACYARHTFKDRSIKKLPGFPPEFKVNGRVVLNITVNPEGKVIAYVLLSADPGCFKVAMETLKYLQFSQKLDVAPGKLRATITFIFQMGTDFQD